MGKDTKFYKFLINDSSPETMPLGRLVEYYDQLNRMLGADDGIHLVEIFKSSLGSSFAIDRNQETQVFKRLLEFKEDTAPKNAVKARDKINLLLDEDKTTGRLVSPLGENVIVFPGISEIRPEPKEIELRDTGSFVGELYQVVGKMSDGEEDFVSIRINTDAGSVPCKATKALARTLSNNMFDCVRVHGKGIWTRNPDGDWSVKSFDIHSFDLIEQKSLREAVDDLRSMDIEWVDDPLGHVKDLNSDDEPVH